MKTEKIIVDGKEIEMVTELPEEEKEYSLPVSELSDTIDLSSVVEEVKEQENGHE